MTASSVLPGFAPKVARTGKEIDLAMQRLWLTGRILPAGARLMVRHVFRSAERRPIEVIYAFALPRDAALRRFRVNGEGFSVRSELQPVAEAIKAYERGIEEGRLATLARQYGDGIVNLTLGNIRPGEIVSVNLEIIAGVEARDDGLRFRFPFTLAPSYHARARAAADPGLGEIELPADEFGDLILPRYAADASGLHEVGFELSIGMAQPIREVGSPSHSVRVNQDGRDQARVRLAPESDLPDRDLVLDVGTEGALAGVLAGADRDGKGRFAAVIPSASFGQTAETPRRVVFVLDRSGSMDGTPIKQGRRAVEACLGALSANDLFGLVAFDDRVEAFGDSLVPGDMEHRERARQFLRGVGARGGTELAQAIAAASRLLGREGGDLMVLTDGQVFGTERIIEQAKSTGVRLHCLGIGSASQDRFLSLLARETGGISRFLTPRERVDIPAVDLFASIGRPLATEVDVATECLPAAKLAPEPPRHVFAGAPLVLFGETAGACEGGLKVSWSGERERRSLVLPLAITAGPLGETLRLIQGARLITDLEAALVEHGGAADRRRNDRIERQLEELSRSYGLASRSMALVAVVERPGDRPGEVPETRVVPVGMPQDTSFSSYFAAPAAFSMPPAPVPARGSFDAVMCSADVAFQAGPPHDQDNGADLLLEFAACIESDGGMPGGTGEERIAGTAIALLSLLAEGNTALRGPFRPHVRRLIAFLEAALAGMDGRERALLDALLKRARRGRPLPGDWKQARPATFWHDLEAALKS